MGSAGTSKQGPPLFVLLFVLLIFALALAGCGLGDGTTAPTTDPSAANSDIAVPTSVDLGVAKVGTTKKTPLALANKGPKPIVIMAITVDNSAFKVTGISYPQTVNSGATYTAQLEFTPSAVGTVSATATVTTDKSNGNGKKIGLLGKGGQGSLVATPAPVAFGRVIVGKSATSTVSLSNSGTVALTVSAMSSSSAQYTLSGATTPFSIQPGANTAVTVRFTPSATGASSSNLSFTNDGASSPIAIAASGNGATAVLAVSPASLSFGSVNVGSTATQSITISNTGTGDLNITSITPTGPFTVAGVTFPLLLPAGQSAVASVAFKPAAGGSATGSIAVVSEAPTVTTSLSGTGTTQPVLSLSPTSMTFWNVNTGATSAQALLLRNTGTGTLTVSAITPTGAGFSVAGFTLPLTINAGASVAGSVVFAPTVGGSATGSVTVTSNSTTAAAPVALSGTGVAPAPQLALTPTSMSFGSITTGQTSSKQLTIRNSGTADLHMTALTPTGAGYSVNGFVLPLTLPAGTTAVGNVVFAPTTAGAVSGSISVTSDSASAVPPVALSGTGVAATAQISITPTTISFGSVTTGQSATTPLTLKNTGTANLNITNVTASGAGYSVNGFILPLTLAPGASGVGNVVFAPTTAGTVNGRVTVTSNSATPAPTVSLSGTAGAAQTFLLSVSPTSLSFGTVTVGATSTLNVSLRNTGTGLVSVSAASITGTGYNVSVNFPITIAAGATLAIPVTFTPALSGLANGSISFSSNATNSPTTVTTTGTGQVAAQHFVDLSWAASSSNVSGYNVYRSTVSGGPYILINASPLASTTYSDGTVMSATTYYYVVRAIDASGVESGNSAEAMAIVP